MTDLCNVSRPVVQAPRPRSSTTLSPTATALYVHQDGGSDSASGTIDAPFATIEHALKMARNVSEPVTIFLHGPSGPYELAAPLYIDAKLSGLTLTSYGGTAATIRGGRTVSPQWQSVTLPGRDPKLRVYMAKNISGNFTALTVGEKRQILSRHPNSDPETTNYPDGTNAYAAHWKMPPGATPDTRVIINSPNRTDWIPLFGNGSGGGGEMAAFYEYVKGGSADRFTPPICPGPTRSCCSNNFPYCGVPGSVSFNVTAALGASVASTMLHNHSGSWTPSPLMAVHGWWTHPVWYNLIFGVGFVGMDKASGTLALNFSRGGNQASQGASTLYNWILEGDLGILDMGGEWYHEDDTLWYALNDSQTEPPSEVIVTEQLSLINVVGTPQDPVVDITITDVNFAYTSSGWFEPFEALGGGDQAIYRGGAVFAEGVERFALHNAEFTNIDGNGVVISGYSRNSTIANCTLVRFGSAAIIVAGHADLIDLTAQNHPINTTIAHNVASDGGVYLKGYFGPLVLAKQQASHIYGNIFFNTPRAAVLFNDGAIGGDLMENNLGFNTNRETQDTGVVYTYDRLVFEFLGPDGKPTVVPQVRTLRNNMFFSNYASVWPIDHDDGSSYYLDRDNVLVYAGTKSFLGGHNMTTTGNLMLWPNLAGWGTAGMLYAANSNLSGYNEFWNNNTVILGDAPASNRRGYLDLQPCDPTNKASPPIPTLITSDNKLFIPTSTEPDTIAAVHCGKNPTPFADWQSTGHDVGTTITVGIPSDDELTRIARALLGLD